MHDELSQADQASKELYAGDVGVLRIDARLALCKLLTGPFVDGDHPHWPAVVREEVILRSRLADVFLELIIDRERRVAFTRQADTGELDTPVLMRSAKLSFLDSVLLLHLREALIDAETRNERAVVDEAELFEFLELYAGGDGDRVGAQKRCRGAIKGLRESSILKVLGGQENRYEVSPALRLLFTANDVEALGKLYRKHASGEPLTASDLEAVGQVEDKEEVTDEQA